MPLCFCEYHHSITLVSESPSAIFVFNRAHLNPEKLLWSRKAWRCWRSWDKSVKLQKAQAVPGEEGGTDTSEGCGQGVSPARRWDPAVPARAGCDPCVRDMGSPGGVFRHHIFNSRLGYGESLWFLNCQTATENTISKGLEIREEKGKQMYFSGGVVMERFHHLNAGIMNAN